MQKQNKALLEFSQFHLSPQENINTYKNCWKLLYKLLLSENHAIFLIMNYA